MTGNIRGDFKSTYFQEIEKEVSKLEKDLKPVNTSGVLGLGRKIVHQFAAGFEKLGRAIKGHGWISREQATAQKIDKTVKDLTEVHQQLKIAYRSSSKVSTEAYKKFNEEVLDQLEKISQVCMLARTKLGKKISEKEVSNVEKDLSRLIDSCRNAIEESKTKGKKEARDSETVKVRAEHEAIPKVPKGMTKRLEEQLGKKEAREAGIAKAKEEYEAIPKVPKGMKKRLEEQLEKRDERMQFSELNKLVEGLEAETKELDKMIEKEKLEESDVDFGEYQRAGDGEDPFLTKADLLERRSLAGLKSELEQLSTRPKNIKVDAVRYKLGALLERMPLEEIVSEDVAKDAAKLSRMIAGDLPTTAREVTKFFTDLRLLFMSVSSETEGIDRAELSKQIRQIENDARSIYE